MILINGFMFWLSNLVVKGSKLVVTYYLCNLLIYIILYIIIYIISSKVVISMCFFYKTV